MSDASICSHDSIGMRFASALRAPAAAAGRRRAPAGAPSARVDSETRATRRRPPSRAPARNGFFCAIGATKGARSLFGDDARGVQGMVAPPVLDRLDQEPAQRGSLSTRSRMLVAEAAEPEAASGDGLGGGCAISISAARRRVARRGEPFGGGGGGGPVVASVGAGHGLPAASAPTVRSARWRQHGAHGALTSRSIAMSALSCFLTLSKALSTRAAGAPAGRRPRRRSRKAPAGTATMAPRAPG